MNELFGPCAARHAGLAAQSLGWSPTVFWNATPADLVLALTTPDPIGNGLSRGELNALLESDHNG